MRIVTGTAKGRALETLEGELIRPTGAKVKEAVFSALQFDIEGRSFLDLFAGSGQMGLEALSRGARRAVFVDSSKDAIDLVKRNAKKTGLFDASHFLVSDFRSYIRKASGKESFNIIYIDPPYKEHWAKEAVRLILKAGIAAPHCIFIAESEEEDIFDGDTPKELSILKKKRYGNSYVTVFTKKQTEE